MEGQGDERQATAQQSCELGQLYRADGSSSFTTGETMVWASVFGPGGLRQSKQKPDSALLDVIFKPKVMGQDAEIERAIEGLINEAASSSVLLKSFPRSHIVLTVQEMEVEGSLASAAINSACLALLDSGIPMLNTFCGVTVAVTEDRQLCVEPDGRTETAAPAIFVFAYKQGQDLASQGNDEGAQLCGCYSRGKFSYDELISATRLGRDAAQDVFGLYRAAITKKLRKPGPDCDAHGMEEDTIE